MKKKLIAAVLAAGMITVSALPVCAADSAQSTKVTVTIAPAYTVTIPTNTNVAFNKLSSDFEKVELTTAQLEPNKAVKVELDASNKLKNEADSTKTITYAINKTDGSAYISELYYAAGDATPLKIDITQAAWDTAYGGSYSDIVTFNISYIDV